MADDPAARIDPRFDPAFQRAGALELGAEPQWGSAATPAPTATGPSGHTEPASADPVGPLDERDLVDSLFAEEPTVSAPRITGWEVAILVAGIALVLLGLVSAWYNASWSGAPMTELEMQLRATSYVLAGPCVVIGLASLLGLLFLRAIAARWSR